MYTNNVINTHACLRVFNLSPIYENGKCLSFVRKSNTYVYYGRHRYANGFTKKS